MQIKNVEYLFSDKNIHTETANPTKKIICGICEICVQIKNVEYLFSDKNIHTETANPTKKIICGICVICVQKNKNSV